MFLRDRLTRAGFSDLPFHFNNQGFSEMHDKKTGRAIADPASLKSNLFQSTYFPTPSHHLGTAFTGPWNVLIPLVSMAAVLN